MIKETAEGILITVKVIPKSSNNEISGWQGDHLKVKLTTAPEKGQANKHLIRLLSQHFKIPQKDILLIRGETSQIKTILLLNKKINDITMF